MPWSSVGVLGRVPYCMHIRRMRFIIRNWLTFLRRLTHPKICTLPAGNPGMPMREFQSKGRKKTSVPAGRQSSRRNSLLLGRGVVSAFWSVRAFY